MVEPPKRLRGDVGPYGYLGEVSTNRFRWETRSTIDFSSVFVEKEDGDWLVIDDDLLRGTSVLHRVGSAKEAFTRAEDFMTR